MLEFLFYLGLLAVLVAFIPFFSRIGAPYVPTHPKTVETMLALMKTGLHTRVADLGSGDGRLVIASAREGAESHGYEINPLLVWLSRSRIKKAGVSGSATIIWANFWHHDFSAYDVIFIYGVVNIMPRLEAKLLKELKPGSRVISNGFIFPNWPVTDSVDGVHVYER